MRNRQKSINIQFKLGLGTLNVWKSILCTLIVVGLYGCAVPDPASVVIDKTIEGTRIGDVPIKLRNGGMPLEFKPRLRCETGYGHCVLPQNGPVDVICGCTTTQGQIISGGSVSLSISAYREWEIEVEAAQKAKDTVEAINEKAKQ